MCDHDHAETQSAKECEIKKIATPDLLHRTLLWPTHRLSTRPKARRDVERDLNHERILWLPQLIHPGFYGEVTKYFRSVGVEADFEEVGGLAHALELAAEGSGLVFCLDRRHASPAQVWSSSFSVTAISSLRQCSSCAVTNATDEQRTSSMIFSLACWHSGRGSNDVGAKVVPLIFSDLLLRIFNHFNWQRTRMVDCVHLRLSEHCFSRLLGARYLSNESPNVRQRPQTAVDCSAGCSSRWQTSPSGSRPGGRALRSAD